MKNGTARCRLIVIICLCAIFTYCGGTAVRADDDADFAAAIQETGESYLTLQEAVDVVGDDETILLLKDVTENIISEGRSYTLDMQEHTLSGGGNGSVYRVTDGRVTLKNGTLTGGYLPDTSDDDVNRGGGLYMGGTAHVTLAGVAIAANYARDGGGVAVAGGNLVVIDSDFLDNYAYADGGGIWTSSPDSVISLEGNIRFLGSSAPGAAAMYICCTLRAEGCEFSANNGDASDENSAVLFFSGNGTRTFTNCGITDNYSVRYTVCLADAGTTVFENCLISRNKAALTGGIYQGDGFVRLKNTVIRDNEAGAGDEGAGGVYLAAFASDGSGFIWESGAIYGNKSGSGADDLYIAAQEYGKFFIPAASDMEDGDVDFTNYEWRDPDGTSLSAEELSVSVETSLSLTAYDPTLDGGADAGAGEPDVAENNTINGERILLWIVVSALILLGVVTGAYLLISRWEKVRLKQQQGSK